MLTDIEIKKRPESQFQRENTTLKLKRLGSFGIIILKRIFITHVVRIIKMELDKLWNWQKKKLACRIRPENGNPAGDSLREMFVELAGVDLNELLNEMKQTKKKKELVTVVFIK